MELGVAEVLQLHDGSLVLGRAYQQLDVQRNTEQRLRRLNQRRRRRGEEKRPI